jgi:hypothetical protein
MVQIKPPTPACLTGNIYKYTEQSNPTKTIKILIIHANTINNALQMENKTYPVSIYISSFNPSTILQEHISLPPNVKPFVA